MIKKSFLLGAIVSIITTNAIANQVITSQTYVDNADALKVNIAQGVGTNNANVGKTLVVNSSGNLELGTPAAGNYVEDSITDGVTNKAPSENAVHDALAGKQDTIEADTMEFDVDYGSGGVFHYNIPTAVSYDSTNGIIGDQYGIIDATSVEDVEGQPSIAYFSDSDGAYSTTITDKLIPTARIVANTFSEVYEAIDKKQHKIPRSGICSGNNPCSDGNGNFHGDWLNESNKGQDILTATRYDGQPGRRKIFETSDVSAYHATGLTQNQKDIQDISIPTVGAMMSAISAATPTLPTGTANTVVMYNNSGAIGGSRAIYDGSATYNATNDATKLVTANGVSKMKECTRWIDNAAHTDENCLLWRLP